MRIPRLTWPGGPAETAEKTCGPKEMWLDPAQARHGVTVLRLKAGDRVEIAGPAGLAPAWVILAESGGRGRPPRLGLVLDEGGPGGRPRPGPKPGEATPGPRLALALISLPRFDWAVEKAVELGAGELWPLVCERVKPGLVRAATGRAGRWQRLAEEARKQCGRPWPLVIHPAGSIEAFISQAKASGAAGFFLSPPGFIEEPGRIGESPAAAQRPCGQPSDTAILVGPEGGFSPREEAVLLAAGFKPWRLGSLVLRSETAALAALAWLSTGV